MLPASCRQLQAGSPRSPESRADCPQVALRRSRDCGIRVGYNVHLPPTTIDLVERKRLECFKNATDSGGAERNQIWIAAHEAEVAPILHHRKDITCEQRTLAVGTRRPVTNGATFEMAPAVDQRQLIPKRKGCAFPKLNTRAFVHDPLAVGGV